MAMFHTMTLTFRFDTKEDLTGVIKSAIQADDFRESVTVEHAAGSNQYVVSYVESSYCQVSEVLSFAQAIAEECPLTGFTMDAWAQNEGSGGNYTDSIIARYSQNVLWHEYYSTAEGYAPEAAAEIGCEERLVETDASQLIVEEGTKETYWESLLPYLPSVTLCSEVIKYDETISFRLPPEYYISKDQYNPGFICLVEDETGTEESFACEIRLLPLGQKVINASGSVKYFRLPDPPEALISGELVKGKMFDAYRKTEEGYPITLKLAVTVPQGYILELESVPFVYEGKSVELEKQHLAGFRRMLDVCKAVRVNGEPLQLVELTPELLKSVIAPSPDDKSLAVDVSEILRSVFHGEEALPRGEAKGEAKRKVSPEEKKWLKEYGQYVENNPVIDFGGKIFAFTGLDAAGSFADESNPVVLSVVSKGGIYRSKVSGKTNYLVVNPQYAGKSKVDAALEQKTKGKEIKIILLEDLKKLL